MPVVTTPKKGKPDKELIVNGTTIEEVRKNYSKSTGVDFHRIAFKDANVTDKKNPNLKNDHPVTDKDKLIFKDLGLQVNYTFVFLMEYLGPLALVLLWSTRPAFLYPAEVQGQLGEEYHPVAKTAILCWTAHFLKREFESYFVHRFSHPTMPIKQLFINCTYYWSFGATIGYPLAHPGFKDFVPSDLRVQIGLAIFVICEIGNLICHIMLSNLRPPGTKERKIPHGFLFDYVVCPNYTFEVFAWVGFSIMTNIYLSWVFTLFGFYQMTEWAFKKHKMYKADFGDQYTKLKRNKVIIPFVL